MKFSYRHFELVPFLNEQSAKIFGPDYPRATDLELYTRLALVSTHPAIDFAEPLPPNVIPVGGLQIKEPKPLPKVINISVTVTNFSLYTLTIFDFGN